MHEDSNEKNKAASTFASVKRRWSCVACNERRKEKNMSMMQFNNFSVWSDEPASVSMIFLQTPIVMQNCSFVVRMPYAERGRTKSTLCCLSARMSRRNMLCNANWKLKQVSVKGGNGKLPGSSLWIVNEGCELFHFCKLPGIFSIHLPTDKYDYLADTTAQLVFPEAHGVIHSSILEVLPDEAEVTVSILFGPICSASTSSAVLKNRSKTLTRKEGKLVEGTNEVNTLWELVVIIITVVIVDYSVNSFVYVCCLTKEGKLTSRRFGRNFVRCSEEGSEGV
ncbi:uncharacterized protein MONOS_1754 [Monocercomonoides exilis]|uniref:uncharacterized protein n=1 Tax=Monocercomonoides exilis TaxID=2049356 RepID=UPI00355A387D|nr:hypothetical protein MONOS_1754 [Monocercomonoides exilis]|eukprot:MONOS_1754.1-p1 / transcript=MONOS_1754.1 / gene=MONOS_1754 / organism=Monocercomonoides_exilis_PA203 / gene_product=unspecified product / transcript_product=unspecified product / location=Mono_scaffold00032:147562-148780(+) / protein_length=280 / sequence_SO=supercontig / SO=protein_coding / is_pseudo=false